METYHSQGGIQGELMGILLRERPRFATEEEFKEYALTEVRRFIADLRSLNIEVTLHAQYSHYGSFHQHKSD